MDIRSLLTVMIEYRRLWKQNEKKYGSGAVFMSSVSYFFQSLINARGDQLPREYMEEMEIEGVPSYHSLNDLCMVSFR